MPPGEAHWWLNLVALCGIAILAVPVWSLNFRKKQLQRIRGALPDEPGRFKDRVKAILAEKWDRDVTGWRRVDEICLFAGYVCLLGSAFLRLFVPAG